MLRNNIINKLFICLLSIMVWSPLAINASDGFIITGNIPGMPNGAIVRLVNAELKRQPIITETRVYDNKFTLSGSIDKPALGNIRIYPDNEEENYKVINIMIENVPIQISAVHYDNIPPDFYNNPNGLLLEKEIKINGGSRHQGYEDYRNAIFPYEMASKKAHHVCFGKMEKGIKIDSVKYDAFIRAKLEETEACKRYVMSHLESSISGYFLVEFLKTPFSMTKIEIDEIERLFENVDPYRKPDVREALEFAKKYIKYSDFRDLTFFDSDGREHELSEFIHDNERAILIDFWASWCGPCRAALKQLKQIYGKNNGKIDFLSVSIDENKENWLKAIKQEGMPWAQFHLDKDGVDFARESYQTLSIPTFIIITPNGKIYHFSHDPKRIDFIISTVCILCQNTNF